MSHVAGSSPELRHGWAIPAATDIAFALAVLAVIGSALPTQLRAFLLTLAVVDDLIAIAIIAIFYTEQVSVLPLMIFLIPVGIFGYLVQRCRQFFGEHPAAAWLILLPIAVVAWALLHASGIHATIAGVVLGFTVPVIRSAARGGPAAGPGLAEYFELPPEGYGGIEALVARSRTRMKASVARTITALSKRAAAAVSCT